MASQCSLIVRSAIASEDELRGNTTDRTVGTAVRLYCQLLHTLLGPEVLQCTSAGWDKPVPKCIPDELKVDTYLKDWCTKDNSMEILYGVSGAVGGLCLTILLALFVVYCLRQRRRHRKLNEWTNSAYSPSTMHKPDQRHMYPHGHMMNTNGGLATWNNQFQTFSSRSSQRGPNMVLPFNNYHWNYPNPMTRPGYGGR